MCLQGLANLNTTVFTGGENMKSLLVRVNKALTAENRRVRNRAVDWLSRNGMIESLLEIMDNSKYPHTKVRAQDALAKYSFK